MKKVCLLCLVLLSAVLPVNSCFGKELQSGPWEYELLENGTAMIRGYDGMESDVIIPNTLDDISVSTLSCDTFVNNENMISVSIPDTLISIKFFSDGDIGQFIIDNETDDTDKKFVNPFIGCHNLSRIEVSEDNPVFTAVNGVLLIRESSEIVRAAK